MDLPDDTLPDKPLKRFVVGSCVCGLVAFAAVILHSSRPTAALVDAGVVAAVCGVAAGIFAAFGKKILRSLLTLAAEIFFHP
jgi:hypothetical protein